MSGTWSFGVLVATTVSVLLCTVQVFADEAIDWDGYQKCRTGLITVSSDGGLVEVPVSSGPQGWTVFVAQREDQIGVYLTSFGSGLAYFARLPLDPKGVGASNIDVEVKIPDLQPIPMVLSFWDGQWVSSEFPAANEVRDPGITPVLAEKSNDFTFRFAMQLSFEASIGSLPARYLYGATDGKKRSCLPKSDYLAVLSACEKSNDLGDSVRSIRSRFDLIKEVDCASR